MKKTSTPTRLYLAPSTFIAGEVIGSGEKVMTSLKERQKTSSVARLGCPL